ncbi:16S rRNA (guanine(966)-N(2))-methyltransferase RsmD [Arthrobacter sp. I2-34]|uniref:16S rRNA (Guanine(966)-N(2))-methyltransferase RsmD n=1 Tax=Arthrobacter hankyongi TaxID=2904801 RepID=A0ABS9L6Y9_9MICC|nr:16S rRNA (guanine(966)-N(2))-methyltransferase RsmD [Arthrobacter hankyongi]MCG2622348.1 16S rRNA (guanine(966)-N(2))-methyltransferase RsmD [Arthrobacter hankyongi]
MSRIIAGVAGGAGLANVPGDKTRPTTDRVKEALFSRLDSYGVLAGARVLDLFAGSGALGVESASRGAAEVDLVEQSDKAAGVCRKNAELVNKALRRTVVRVHRSGVQPFLDRLHPHDRWDLVLMDPPYPLPEAELAQVLDTLAPRLAEGAVVVIERSSRSPEPRWPAGLERFAEKKYGETMLWYAEPAPPAS